MCIRQSITRINSPQTTKQIQLSHLIHIVPGGILSFLRFLPLHLTKEVELCESTASNNTGVALYPLYSLCVIAVIIIVSFVVYKRINRQKSTPDPIYSSPASLDPIYSDIPAIPSITTGYAYLASNERHLDHIYLTPINNPCDHTNTALYSFNNTLPIQTSFNFDNTISPFDDTTSACIDDYLMLDPDETRVLENPIYDK